MSHYVVKLNDEITCATDLAVVAQAAWNRASRDRDSAQRGGVAELWRDQRLLARVQPETLIGHEWPDPETPLPDLRDVFKALLQLLRTDGWDAKEIAEAMTGELGFPTTRARIDAMRGSTSGKRTEVTHSEIIAVIYAAIKKHRREDEK